MKVDLRVDAQRNSDVKSIPYLRHMEVQDAIGHGFTWYTTERK
jgi:hypothetical protein